MHTVVHSVHENNCSILFKAECYVSYERRQYDNSQGPWIVLARIVKPHWSSFFVFFVWTWPPVSPLPVSLGPKSP